MRKPIRLANVALAGLALAVGCSDNDTIAPNPADLPAQSIATSLHGTARGMRTWYVAAGGFQELSGVDYEQVGCKNCHVNTNNCLSCHRDSRGMTALVDQQKCISCHSRQASEMSVSDVHRARGMGCESCHTSKELHGDGTLYASMFDEGAMEASCEGCHDGTTAAAAPATQAHTVHDDRLACSTCHMQTSVTCINCHFETEIAENRKLPVRKVLGWQFLGNFRGKVSPMNFQSVTYDGKSFAAWGPYFGHTVSEKGRGCNDCHGSTHVREYMEKGTLKLATWNPTTKSLGTLTGIIPVPPDYGTALTFDWLTRSTGPSPTWILQGSGPPTQAQMLYGQPLSREQLQKLAIPR